MSGGGNFVLKMCVFYDMGYDMGFNGWNVEIWLEMVDDWLMWFWG